MNVENYPCPGQCVEYKQMISMGLLFSQGSWQIYKWLSKNVIGSCNKKRIEKWEGFVEKLGLQAYDPKYWKWEKSVCDKGISITNSMKKKKSGMS